MRQFVQKQYRLDMAKHCFISRGKLKDLLLEHYGRINTDLCLKVFDQTTESIDTAKWGDDPPKGEPRLNSSLVEATQIQNICWMHGLAPRVYGLETVHVCNRLCPMQLTDYVNGKYPTQDEAQAVYDKVIELGEKYGFGVEKQNVSAADVVNGQLVDLQTFAFTKPYQETVKDIYIEKAKYGKVYYQDVPELGLSGGPRKTEQRIKELSLDQVDFKGKSVLDAGCAGGYFCVEAKRRGAKNVIGVDLDTTAAKHLVNYLRYFNVNFYSLDLRDAATELKIENTDLSILFFLSMNYHIDIPEWIQNFNFVIFEDNGKESRNHDKLGKPWTDWFKNIKLVGRATDHGNKPIYHLSK